MTTVDRNDPDVERLWNDFHGLVNMSGDELRTWLLTEASGEVAFPADPDMHLPTLGRSIVRLLNKRRVDLGESDLSVMRDTVTIIRRELAAPRPNDDAWRRGLMTLGHDPLKPGSARPDEENLPGPDQES